MIHLLPKSDRRPYRAYTPDTSEAQARLAFELALGYPPLSVYAGIGGSLRLGPVAGSMIELAEQAERQDNQELAERYLTLAVERGE